MKCCQNCGNSAPDDAEYCSVCGTTFDDPRPGTQVSRETMYIHEPAPQPPEPAPIPEERVSTPVTVVVQAKPQKAVNAKKKATKESDAEDAKTDRLGLVCVTIIILASLGVLVFTGTFSDSNETSDATKTNSPITQIDTKENDTWDRVKDTASEAWDETKDAAERAWGDIKDAWNSAMDD